MPAREAFGVIVRTVGLLVFLYGTYGLVSAIAMKLSFGGAQVTVLGTTIESMAAAPMTSAIILGAVSLAIGLWLMLGAAAIVDRCYRRTD